MTPPHASIIPAAPEPPMTSSPNTTTVGSRSISCASASLIACMNVILRAMGQPSVGDVDVGRQLAEGGLRGRLRLRDGVLDQLRHLAIDQVELVLAEDTGARHA